VQDRSILCLIDLRAPPHRIDARTQTDCIGQIDQSREHDLIETLPREVHIQANSLAAESLDTMGIAREQVAHRRDHLAHRHPVALQGEDPLQLLVGRLVDDRVLERVDVVVDRREQFWRRHGQVAQANAGGVGPADRPVGFEHDWATIRSRPGLLLGGLAYTWATNGPEQVDRVFGLVDAQGVPSDGALAALSATYLADESRTGGGRPSG